MRRPIRSLPYLLALILALPVAASGDVVRDVAYDAQAEQAASRRRLDVYPSNSKSEAGVPILVYVHGGGWTGGDKAKVHNKPAWAAELDLVLVSVEYRLLPEGRHPATVEDLAAAIAWLVEHASAFGGDPESIFLLGHSTGGHVVSLLAADDRYLAPHGMTPGHLGGVITLDSSALDLELLVRLLPAAPRQRYLDVFGPGPEDWREASPIRRVSTNHALPPFLLLVAGAGDSTEAINRRFAQRLATIGTDVTLEVYPDETHGSINRDLGLAGHAPTQAIEAFIQGRLNE